MPELPEVETIRRALAPRIEGRRVVDAGAFASSKFTDALDIVSVRIESVDRRGKYLVIMLDDERDLVIHLGMTGLLRSVKQRSRDDKYLRAWWTLDDTTTFEFSDIRRFGRVAVVPSGDYQRLPTLHALGPEPLDGAFDAREFHRALNASQRAIKTQLLSQRPVAGVGNIYADEALWIARVKPSAGAITRPKAQQLRDAIIEVLSAGIERKGTTLRDYRTFDGDYGENQHYLRCYGRGGEPCDRCGATLRRTIIDARSTTHCPTCQRA